MNERIITFSAHALVLSDKTLHPQPAKMHIPDWYKAVPNPQYPSLQRTIKACKPFLDSLTAGYIIKNTVDQKINFNVPDPDGKLNTWVEISKDLESMGNFIKTVVNFNKGDEYHDISQIGTGCPYAQKNKGFGIYKILNAWTVHVPKDYAVLYMPLLNRPEDRFEILSGIVDGPNPLPTNFPCYFKKQGTWVLEKGEPIAAVFPFKKENWKMKVSEKTEFDHTLTSFRYASKLRKWYEDKLWKKIKWS